MWEHGKRVGQNESPESPSLRNAALLCELAQLQDQVKEIDSNRDFVSRKVAENMSTKGTKSSTKRGSEAHCRECQA